MSLPERILSLKKRWNCFAEFFMEKQLRLEIYGKVQGVSFRVNTKRKADKLNLTGWVQNNKNGTVSALAQGEKEKLEKLLEWSRVGPPLARVEKVKADWEKLEQEFDDFTVRY